MRILWRISRSTFPPFKQREGMIPCFLNVGARLTRPSVQPAERHQGAVEGRVKPGPTLPAKTTHSPPPPPPAAASGGQAAARATPAPPGLTQRHLPSSSSSSSSSSTSFVNAQPAQPDQKGNERGPVTSASVGPQEEASAVGAGAGPPRPEVIHVDSDADQGRPDPSDHDMSSSGTVQDSCSERSEESEEDPLDTTGSCSGLLWKALTDGRLTGDRVTPRPFMPMRDSSHLTTQEQQVAAYRCYEEFIAGMPGNLKNPEHLLEVANTLLYLPETFPASYLMLHSPLINSSTRLALALGFVPLEFSPIRQTQDLENLQSSIVGYSFLTAAQHVADLFFAVRDIKGVQSAKFPRMVSYCDPDYWLAGLLLAYDAHKNAPPTRAAALPVVIGSPGSDKQSKQAERQGTLLDLQLNIPPAVAVAFLAGRAYQRPTCPGTVLYNPVEGAEQHIKGTASAEILAEWDAETSQHHILRESPDPFPMVPRGAEFSTIRPPRSTSALSRCVEACASSGGRRAPPRALLGNGQSGMAGHRIHWKPCVQEGPPFPKLGQATLPSGYRPWRGRGGRHGFR